MSGGEATEASVIVEIKTQMEIERRALADDAACKVAIRRLSSERHLPAALAAIVAEYGGGPRQADLVELQKVAAQWLTMSDVEKCATLASENGQRDARRGRLELLASELRRDVIY
jgi:hypothetical protein